MIFIFFLLYNLYSPEKNQIQFWFGALPWFIAKRSQTNKTNDTFFSDRLNNPVILNK